MQAKYGSDSEYFDLDVSSSFKSVFQSKDDWSMRTDVQLPHFLWRCLHRIASTLSGAGILMWDRSLLAELHWIKKGTNWRGWATEGAFACVPNLQSQHQSMPNCDIQDLEDTTGSWELYGQEDEKRYPSLQAEFFNRAAAPLTRRESLLAFTFVGAQRPGV